MKQLLFLIFLSMNVKVPAQQKQDFLFRHLTTANGLLSDMRLSFTEDRLGRLWIGSDEGLSVFDGYELSNFRAGEASGLKTSYITAVYCDPDGCIWIGGNNVLQYKKEDENFFRAVNIPSATTGNVGFFATLDHDRLIFAIGRNFYLLDKSNNQLKLLSKLANDLPANRAAIRICQFEGNEFLLGFGDQILLVDVAREAVIQSYPYRAAWALCKVDEERFLAGSFVRDSVAIINKKTGAVDYIQHWPTDDSTQMDGFINDIRSTGNNRFAMSGRYQGLYIADLTAKTFEHATHNTAITSSIRSNYLTKLFVSSNRTLFVNAPGISYTQLTPQPFKSNTVFTNEKGEGYDGVINCFTEDHNKTLWIGTNSYLIEWNRNKKTSRYYAYIPDKASGVVNTIRAVAVDQLNRVWASGFGSGLAMLKADGSFQYFKPDRLNRNSSLPDNEILGITKDKNGNFVIATGGGVCFFDPVKKVFKNFFEHPKMKKVASIVTYCAMLDSKENLWLGTRNGLFCLGAAQDSVHKIELPAVATTANASTIYSIVEDAGGKMYVGGLAGVYRVDRDTRRVEKNISSKDGLGSNVIASLICDNENNLWISGNRGLARYHITSGELKIFDAKDGVLQGNHKIFGGYISPSGELFFGGEDGMNYFFPKDIASNAQPPRAFVTELQLADTLINTLSQSDFSLPYFQNNISVNYLAVDYKLADYIQYRYRLKGFDTAFIYSGKQRTARYTNLPHGNFEFILEVTANGKDWFPANAPVHLKIRQAFWKTWWFIALVLGATATGIFLLYRNRVNQVKAKELVRTDYEIKLNELENSALRTQMNPHFIFNSLNTINSFINRNEGVRANQYISKFSRLIRLILDHSREKKILLQDELDVLDLYVQIERIRFDNKFDYQLSVADDIDASAIEIPPLIIQPFIENAILHGLLPKEDGGLLQLIIERKDNVLLCIIEDNGVGRIKAAEQKHLSPGKRKSHGMEITLKRIELFNKEHGLDATVNVIDKTDVTGASTGTRVEVRVPWLESF